ncbi:FecR family protein [Mucilaginibacter pedocola]|uniref:Iron dicitrate transport regulator FecR n=1 Tax=Mucilaginibacter pedocola TaxID=1792845 RepID=A0A1S9P7I1_9SPHI|nr:FecR domain-containing protein [Mucilaginibacter pedocola]OOQ56923.1 hypothetical protein BC343_17180 [Mucilaginibacter pedocola]
MQRHEIHDLLKRYNTGTCTDFEKELVETWYLQYEAADTKDITDEEREADLAAIWNALPVNQPKFGRIKLMYRIAAAAVLLVFLSAGLYYATHRGPNQQEVIQTIARNLTPGSNKAILTLGDGKQVILTGAANGQLASQNNIAVTKTADGQVTYLLGTDKKANAGPVIYNTMATPMGGTYDLTLSDGTRVSLDAASSIRYPVSFNGNERKVEITGQAYFEVAHDSSKPFRVIAAGQTVEVLGTHFNVNAYGDENTTTTTLLEGSVKVSNARQTALLVPGQQAAVAKGNINIQVKQADTETALAWKNGQFRFKRADLQAVMRQFARWYKVEVVYEGDVPEAAITGKVLRTANAEQVLKIVNNLGIKFKTDGKKIVIMKN